eukprot:g5415.t1
MVRCLKKNYQNRQTYHLDWSEWHPKLSPLTPKNRIAVSPLFSSFFTKLHKKTKPGEEQNAGMVEQSYQSFDQASNRQPVSCLRENEELTNISRLRFPGVHQAQPVRRRPACSLHTRKQTSYRADSPRSTYYVLWQQVWFPAESSANVQRLLHFGPALNQLLDFRPRNVHEQAALAVLYGDFALVESRLPIVRADPCCDPNLYLALECKVKELKHLKHGGV